MFNLRNRSFLKEIDFQPRELRHLLELSSALKVAKYAGTEAKRLEGKEIALIFEKSSTRTRSAFEVAAFDQGAHVTAVSGVDFIHTDVWVSMGESKDVWSKRVELLRPYQVSSALLEKTGNPKVKFMHCLPAFHDPNTTVGREMMEHTGMSEGLESLARSSSPRPASSSTRPRIDCTRSRRCWSRPWVPEGRHHGRP